MSSRNENSIPRRYLPSFALLSAFEAVARRQSVTDAAQELSLTQGAVSRQLQKLENQIGAALFVRDKQRLGLTPAGAAYLDDVRRGMNLISNAGIKLHVNPNGGALNLAILPALPPSYYSSPPSFSILSSSESAAGSNSTVGGVSFILIL